MEITCEQCGTVFSVDPDAVAVGTREVVCPGCFQFHTLPATEESGGEDPESGPSETAISQIGNTGIADRLRDGFTLTFEVRHPEWSSVRELNPYEIQQCIYDGEFDGQEEYREKAGRWFPIGDHPRFALTFQLVGVTLASTTAEPAEAAQRKFVGWKSATQARPGMTPVQPSRAVEPTPETDLEPTPALKSRKWVWFIGAGVALVAAGTLLAILL